MSKFLRVRGTTFVLNGVAIGNIKSVTPPNGMKREMTDVSSIQDLYDVFAPGTVDPGSVALKINVGDPTLYNNVWNDFNDNDNVSWSMVYPDGSSHSGMGNVSDGGYDEGDRKGVFTATVTIKVSGGILFTPAS